MASITRNPTTLLKNWSNDPLHRAVDSTYALETTRRFASLNAESSTNDSIWNASPVCISRCMRLKAGLGVPAQRTATTSLSTWESHDESLLFWLNLCSFETYKNPSNQKQQSESWWILVDGRIPDCFAHARNTPKHSCCPEFRQNASSAFSYIYTRKSVARSKCVEVSPYGILVVGLSSRAIWWLAACWAVCWSPWWHNKRALLSRCWAPLQIFKSWLRPHIMLKIFSQSEICHWKWVQLFCNRLS